MTITAKVAKYTPHPGQNNPKTTLYIELGIEGKKELEENVFQLPMAAAYLSVKWLKGDKLYIQLDPKGKHRFNVSGKPPRYRLGLHNKDALPELDAFGLVDATVEVIQNSRAPHMLVLTLPADRKPPMRMNRSVKNVAKVPGPELISSPVRFPSEVGRFWQNIPANTDVPKNSVTLSFQDGTQREYGGLGTATLLSIMELILKEQS